MFSLVLFCLITGLKAQTYNVTFKVNMNEVTDPFTTPEVNGSFNGWCGGCAAMTDADMDGIWEITIALSPGTYEFKYAYDSWAGQESLTPGSPCTITSFGFTNRTLTVDASDIVLDPVCWGSCDDCGAGTIYNVTFQVNMTGVTESFTTPEVNGVFNGWCGGCAPMSDANADGIWDITIGLPAGTFEYKFAYDTWAGQETLTEGSPCTITSFGFTNRIITVADDIVLDPVIWGTCDAINTTVTPSGSTTICQGSNVTYTAAAGYTAYQWMKNGISISGATSNTYVANAPGNYSVVITSGTATATSVASTLVVSKPAPKIQVMGSLDICTTGSVLLKGKIGVGSTYKWFKNGVQIVGAPLSYTATSIGTYKLTETTSAGCSKSKSVMVTSSCRLTSAGNFGESISIYPNPANHVFTLEGITNATAGVQEVSVIMYSSTGQEVYNETLQVTNGEINKTITLGNDIASGVYMVKIVGNELSTTKSLVIE